MLLCSSDGPVVGLEEKFPSYPGVVGGWAVVILCGSSWIFWWLVKGLCFQVSRVGDVGAVVILCGSSWISWWLVSEIFRS